MIQCLDQLQVSINERLDHLQMLLLDANQLSLILKDDEKKRAVVRNFRIIKEAEKSRTALQNKELIKLSKNNKRLTKHEINVCENMFVNSMNQYLNTQYESKNSGQVNDIIDAFIYYFENVHAQFKINQLKVIKNCGLFYETNVLYENLSFFIGNIQQSLNHVYQKKKSHFFNCLKNQNRTISPQKRSNFEDQEIDKFERFDKSGSNFSKKKKKLQNYCYQLARILQLQYITIDYFYFSAMDIERRKKVLSSNFLKRNIHILRQLESYQKDYQNFKNKKINSEQNLFKNKKKDNLSSQQSKNN